MFIGRLGIATNAEWQHYLADYLAPSLLVNVQQILHAMQLATYVLSSILD